MTTTTTTSSHYAAGPLGVWPWPGDRYDEAALQDPVEAAKAYVLGTVGMSQATTVSAFEGADETFGYVEFGGDLRSTVALRRIGGRWHVESASSELITAHGNADGSITFVAEQDGEMVEWVGGAPDTQGDSSVGHPVKAGEELWRLQPSDEPRRARFLLSIDEPAPNSEFNVAGLTEVRAPQATFQEQEVPLDAVWSEGGADVHEIAEAYVADRFGDVDRVLLGEQIDDTHYEMTTGETDISLRKHDDLWYVVGASSETVALRMSQYDGKVVDGEVVVTQASRLTIQLWTREGELVEERTESATAGTVPYRFELAGEPAAIVRVTALTDESETYLAEAAIVAA